MKYDILFAPHERDDPEIFMDWAVYEENMSLPDVVKLIALELEVDAINGHEEEWVYRIVQHGKWGV